MNIIEKKIIPVEIDLGFIRIPNKFKYLFPKTDSRIDVFFDMCRSI
jgi:hypothetical protein